MNAAIFSSAPRWWQWRARLRQWWQGRLTAADAVLLTQRNVYILPTRAGLMLALTLGVLLIASINYQLNLGYLFTFLLAGCAAAGVWVGHGTLRGLGLKLLPPQPVFAGQPAFLDVRLSSARAAPRHAMPRCLPRSPRYNGRREEVMKMSDCKICRLKN